MVWMDVAPQAQSAFADIRNLSHANEISSTKYIFNASLGSIRFGQAETQKVQVYLVEDAHAVASAQKSIEELLLDLVDQKAIDEVFVEGASRKLDVDLLRAYPKQEDLRSIFDRMYERGELSGASVAALFSQFRIPWIGMENEEVYEKGIRFYLDAKRDFKKVQAQLNDVLIRIEEQKTTTYSKDYYEWNQLLKKWQDHGDGLRELLVKGEARVDLTVFPQLQKLREAMMQKTKMF